MIRIGNAKNPYKNKEIRWCNIYHMKIQKRYFLSKKENLITLRVQRKTYKASLVI